MRIPAAFTEGADSPLSVDRLIDNAGYMTSPNVGVCAPLPSSSLLNTHSYPQHNQSSAHGMMLERNSRQGVCVAVKAGAQLIVAECSVRKAGLANASRFGSWWSTRKALSSPPRVHSPSPPLSVETTISKVPMLESAVRTIGSRIRKRRGLVKIPDFLIKKQFNSSSL